jgi:hypothetical protein
MSGNRTGGSDQATHTLESQTSGKSNYKKQAAPSKLTTATEPVLDIK